MPKVVSGWHCKLRALDSTPRRSGDLRYVAGALAELGIAFGRCSRRENPGAGSGTKGAAVIDSKGDCLD